MKITKKEGIIITKERILELIPKHFEDVLESNYSNPIRDAVEEAVKEKEGVIKKLVNEVISEVLITEEFKKKITEQIIINILRKELKN